jgi:hypothetical protein
MLKKILFMIMILLSVSIASAYTIDYVNNDVYINTAQVKILVKPFQLNNSGCAYINITNKNNNNQYDLVVGSDANASVSSISLLLPNGNGSKSFVQQNVSTIYTTYNDKTVWYETNAIQMNKNTDLYLELCMNIVAGSSGKYDVGAHLSSQTLAQAIAASKLLLLDPWWNSTSPPDYGGSTYPNYWSTINNGSSTARIQTVYPYQNDLVFYMGGEGTVNDNLGKYAMTNGGMTFGTGKIGQAAVGTYAKTTTNFEISDKTSPRTFCFWTNASGTASWQNIIDIGTGSGASYGSHEAIQIYGGAPYALYVNSWGGGGYVDWQTPYNFSTATGVWKHFCLAQTNATTATLYVNGSYFANTTAMNMGSSASVLQIGKWDASAQPLGVGQALDEIAIYKRVLSASEISNLYNNNVGLKYQQVNLRQNYLYATNLVSMYRFENNSLDENYLYSATSNNNTYTTSGKIDSSAAFDGTQVVVINDNSQFSPANNNITIVGWAKRVNDSTAQRAIFTKATVGAYEWTLTSDNSNVYYILYQAGGSGYESYYYAKDNRDNLWHHYAIVYDKTGTTLIAYYDGVQVGNDTTGTGVLSDTASPINIGREGTGSYAWNGSIDEVAIYNRTLSASEISNLYNSGVGRLYNESANMFYSITDDTQAQSGIWNDSINTVTTGYSSRWTILSTRGCVADSAYYHSYPYSCNSNNNDGYWVGSNISSVLPNISNSFTAEVWTMQKSALHGSTYFQLHNGTGTTCGTNTCVAMGVMDDINMAFYTCDSVTNVNISAMTLEQWYRFRIKTFDNRNEFWVDDRIVGNCTSGVNNFLNYSKVKQVILAKESVSTDYNSYWDDVKIYNYTSANYSAFIMNLSDNSNTTYAKVSSDDGNSWTIWYNNTRNNRSTIFATAGNTYKLQLNISGGNATNSPIIYSFGLTNTTPAFSTYGLLQFMTRDLNGDYIEGMRVTQTSTNTKVYMPNLPGTGAYVCFNSTDNSLYRNTTCS